ncbi:hypothetical protein [Halomonas sp. C05BenzN]|uniref:hypothetical protein n=1 Tax=Halomonas sp. C05BenzN TaxID=3411041 RepID=UPI003B9300CE
MTFARFEPSERQSLARIKELQQDDPTLVPLLAQAVTEFARRQATRAAAADDREPPRQRELLPETWLALILCADGWGLQEIEELMTVRKEMARRELASDERWTLAEADDTNPARDADTRPPFIVHLARTGERLEIRAANWREALERTGRPDACIIKRLGNREFDATFLTGGEPRTLTTRVHYGDDADALAFALANVAHAVDTEAAGQGGQS